MNQAQFRSFCTTASPILLDGATGTHLQQAGMPAGACPEQWVLDHADVLANLQKSYLQAGSSILYTFTFGANRIKLAGHGIAADQCGDMNRRLAMISRDVCDRWLADPARPTARQRVAASQTVLIAGDLAPTGRFLAPAGDLSFESLIDIYRQQVEGLLQAGVDLFIIETMFDLAQVRAAVLAIQSVCDLPIMTSLTFEENGRTLAGNPPLACLLALASMGVAAFGLNCSFGPDKLADLLTPLLQVSPIPLLVKPNAGMPHLVEGKTVFPMDPEAFSAAMKPMITGGISLLGGCCGTSPAHIAAMTAIVGSADQPALAQAASDRTAGSDWTTMIGSSRQTWTVGAFDHVPDLLCRQPEDLENLPDLLDDQSDAAVIDLSECPGTVPVDQLQNAINQVQLLTAVPLIFKDSDWPRLKNLLQSYHGRAGVLVSGEGNHRDEANLMKALSPYVPVLLFAQESSSFSS